MTATSGKDGKAMSKQNNISTYLLIKFKDSMRASKARMWLETALELNPWEIAAVNDTCLIWLPDESELTLQELEQKVFKLTDVDSFELHIARAGRVDGQDYFKEVGTLTYNNL